MFQNITEDTRPLSLYLIFLIVYVGVCIFGSKNIAKDVLSESKSFNLLFLSFFILYATFYAINSDYFRYRFWCEEYEQLIDYFHKEHIYMSVAAFVKGNYDFFRAIIWGGAIIISYLVAKFQRINTLLSMFILFSLFSDKICYNRSFLGMAIFFMGVTIISSDYSKIIRYGIGSLLCLLSLTLHSSIVIAFLTIPILFINLTKKNLLLFTLFIAGGAIAIVSFIGDGMVFIDDVYTDKINDYAEAIDEGAFAAKSISNYVKLIWNYSVFYLPFLFATNIILSDYEQYYIDQKILSLYKISAGLLIISTALGLAFGIGNVFCYRVLYMSAIPIAFVISSLYEYGLLSKTALNITIVNSVLYTLAYWYTSLTTQGLL